MSETTEGGAGTSSCPLGQVGFVEVMTFFFFKDFIYLFTRGREAETQAEGEAGSTQGALHGTRSRASRTRPWAEGSAKPLSHPGCPTAHVLM